MLWIILIVIAVIGQWYMVKFQDSEEGKDERGREIRLKTNSTLFGVLYSGSLLIYILYMLDVISIEYFPNTLLGFLCSMGVFGAISTYINKNKKNY